MRFLWFALSCLFGVFSLVTAACAAFVFERNIEVALALTILLTLLTVLCIFLYSRVSRFTAGESAAADADIISLEFTQIHNTQQGGLGTFFFKNSRLHKLALACAVVATVVFIAALVLLLFNQNAGLAGAALPLAPLYAALVLALTLLCNFAVYYSVYYVKASEQDAAALEALRYFEITASQQAELFKTGLLDGGLSAAQLAAVELSIGLQQGYIITGMQMVTTAKPALLPLFRAGLSVLEKAMFELRACQFHMPNESSRAGATCETGNAGAAYPMLIAAYKMLSGMHSYLKGEESKAVASIAFAGFKDYAELSEQYIKKSC